MPPPCRLEQWQQLEAKLRAAERELLGDQHIRRLGVEQLDQGARALRPEGVVQWRAVETAELAQAFIARPHRRQLMEARLPETELHRAAARYQQHVEAARRQSARQHGSAPDVADAQEMLHMEENALHASGTFGWPNGTLGWSSVTLPSARAEKKCRQRQSSFIG